MATPRPPKVVLGERERADLKRVMRAYTTGQHFGVESAYCAVGRRRVDNLQIAP
jgi:hypothetical protein